MIINVMMFYLIVGTEVSLVSVSVLWTPYCEKEKSNVSNFGRNKKEAGGKNAAFCAGSGSNSE